MVFVKIARVLCSSKIYMMQRNWDHLWVQGPKICRTSVSDLMWQHTSALQCIFLLTALFKPTLYLLPVNPTQNLKYWIRSQMEGFVSLQTFLWLSTRLIRPARIRPNQILVDHPGSRGEQTKRIWPQLLSLAYSFRQIPLTNCLTWAPTTFEKTGSA